MGLRLGVRCGRGGAGQLLMSSAAGDSVGAAGGERVEVGGAVTLPFRSERETRAERGDLVRVRVRVRVRARVRVS